MYSLADPVFADIFGYGTLNYSGQTVTETSALGLSAVYRAVELISGTVANLPLRTLTTNGDMRERANSFLDNPGGEWMTPYEWKKLVATHVAVYNEAFLVHVYNAGGALTALYPVHPTCVSVEWKEPGKPGERLYKVGSVEYDRSTLTHIMAFSLDGLRGTSRLWLAKNGLGTSLAADRAAARMYRNGAMISGLVTPEEDVTPAEAQVIKDSLASKISGVENAGDIAVINRKLRFQPWSMTAEDMQFLQSRQFQVEEVGRWFGVPPHLLMQTEKSTSWGTGIEEQNRAFARGVLPQYTKPIEERLSRLVANPRYVEFDYTAYVQPSPEDEINLLILQVNSGLLTLNEARRIRNMPPLSDPNADLPRVPPGATPPTEQPAGDPNA